MKKLLLTLGAVIVIAVPSVIILSDKPEELTQEKAEQLLLEFLEEHSRSNLQTWRVDRTNESGEYIVSHWEDQNEYIPELAERGLIWARGERESGLYSNLINYYFTFTGDAQPYIVQPENINMGSVDVILARPKDVELLKLTNEPRNAGDVPVVSSEFMIYYELTPFGELDIKNKSGSRLDIPVRQESKGSGYFVLHDDGWQYVGLFLPPTIQ